MKRSNLPNKIAIFPLSDAVFFPRTMLPLNIFEDRYIQLVRDCMKGQRLFGMIQPKVKSGQTPEVYKVGCLGKIVSFNEISDKKFIIALSGIIRFRILKELSNKKLYREFNVDYSDFIDDLEVKENITKGYTDKNLLKKIKYFFNRRNYSVKFNELEKLNFNQLISTICMISAFSVEEKQKLIETIKTKEKLEVLEDIMNFNLLDNQENKTIQ